MTLKAFVGVFDPKTGRVIIERESKSFVIQFLQLVKVAGQDVGKIVKTTDGVTRTVRHPSYGSYPFLKLASGAGDDKYGIQVGTGTTTPANLDYCLESKIAHGTGAGQLEYQATSIADPTEVAGNIDWVISRVFRNASGATITVNEIGMVAMCVADGYYSYFLIARDLLTFDILDGESKSVGYTVRTTA